MSVLSIVSARPDREGTLAMEYALALPVRVVSAAWAVPVEDRLMVLVNRPGASMTDLFRIARRDVDGLTRYDIEPLQPLSFVAAGADARGEQLLVSGADGSGHPVVASVTSRGQPVAQWAIPGATPTHWPIPGWAWRPVVVWQTDHRALEVAELCPGAVAQHRSIPVGGPPLSLVVAASAVWAAWCSPDGIEVVHIQEQETRSLRVPVAGAADMALGLWGDQVCLAWTRASTVSIARIDAAEWVAPRPVSFHLADAHRGRLAVVSGTDPLVWVQHSALEDGEIPSWRSSLLVPGRSSLTIDGLVHAIACCGDRVAVVGAAEVYFLRRIECASGAA